VTVFVLRRFLTLIATLAGASLIIFLVLDALRAMRRDADGGGLLAGSNPRDDDQARARSAIDGSLSALDRRASGRRYGQQLFLRHPVAELIAERLVLTIPLAVMAMLLTVVLALAAGVYTAANHNKIGDVGVMAMTQFGIAIPNFWFAILLILLFSVKLQWLSAGGFAGWGEGIMSGVRSLLLPAISLAVVQAAILARVRVRRCSKYCARISSARRGPKASQGVRYCGATCCANAMIPVMTVMGLQCANLLAGTIVVESVFYLPGLGRLIFQSIANRDLIVVRNCVMLLAAMVVIVNSWSMCSMRRSSADQGSEL